MNEKRCICTVTCKAICYAAADGLKEQSLMPSAFCVVYPNDGLYQTSKYYSLTQTKTDGINERLKIEGNNCHIFGVDKLISKTNAKLMTLRKIGDVKRCVCGPGIYENGVTLFQRQID